MLSASDFLTSLTSERFTIATLVVLGLSKEEFEAFSNPNYIIMNTVVIIDKFVYVNAIRVNIPPGKDIHFFIYIGNRLKYAFRGMLNNGYIDNATYKKLRPPGFKPGVLYGLDKVHKEPKNGVLTF